MTVDIKRINELAKKQKTVGLTPTEKEEQARLRKAFVASITGDLRSQLDNTYIANPDGTTTKLTPNTPSD